MSKPLPDNTDRLWREYAGSRQYHRYDKHQIAASWNRQIALCGKTTTAGNGSFSIIDPTIDRYHPVCGKCRKLMSPD